MDSVILSFLCGAAFIGGATAVVVCLALVCQMKDKTGRDEVKEQWQKQVGLLGDQVATLTRIAIVMEQCGEMEKTEMSKGTASGSR